MKHSRGERYCGVFGNTYSFIAVVLDSVSNEAIEV